MRSHVAAFDWMRGAGTAEVCKAATDLFSYNPKRNTKVLAGQVASAEAGGRTLHLGGP